VVYWGEGEEAGVCLVGVGDEYCGWNDEREKEWGVQVWKCFMMTAL
jgi:hypothetical protein